MRLVIAVTLVALAVGCATTQKADTARVEPPAAIAAPAAVAPAPAATADLSSAVAAVKTYKIGDSREPLTVVQRMVKESLKSPEESRAMAAQLAALLGSDATLDAKQFACRQLVFVGSEENVPAIAPLLLDEKTADMARYALEPMQGAAVDQALIDALDKAPDAAKVGIINSLSARRSGAARDSLRALTKSANPAVADAAKAALQRIGA